MENFYLFNIDDFSVNIEDFNLENIPTIHKTEEQILDGLTDFSSQHVVFQLQPIPKVDNYLRFRIYFPYNQFEKEFLHNKSLEQFCKEFIGYKLIVEKKSEIDLSIKVEQEFNKIFIPYLYVSSTKSFYNIGSIVFDKSNYSEEAYRYYKKKNAIYEGYPTLNSVSRNPSANYTDSGYDTDSAFGGESDAYWNID